MRAIVIDFISKVQWYVTLMLASLVVCVWGLIWVSSPVSKDTTPVMVTIPTGSTAPKVARSLHAAGVIRSRRAFIFTVRSRRESKQLKAGKYELRRSMNMLQIIYILVHGRTAASWVTIPEGFTVRQIAHLLDSKFIIDENRFLTVALHKAERFAGIVRIPSSSLEGYLFPATYLFAPADNPDAVIRQMLEAFRKNVCKNFGADVQVSSLSCSNSEGGQMNPSSARQLYDVVTLASLVEREAKKDKDRALISSVLHNRLRKGMRLQVDATVQYALGGHRTRLFYRDYETPSDYNTYLHGGLPPGPVANPGVRSIAAALHPAKSDYLYYVARPDGYHVFSNSLAAHDRATIGVHGRQ